MPGNDDSPGEDAVSEFHSLSLVDSSADGQSQGDHSTSGLSGESMPDIAPSQAAALTSESSQISSVARPQGQPVVAVDHLVTKKKKGRALETLQQLSDRARRFLGVSPSLLSCSWKHLTSSQPMIMRDRDDTQRKLKSIFDTACRVGGMSQAAKLHTAYGVKDTYQEVFMDKIFAVCRKLTGSIAEKQKTVDELVETFPPVVSSPVWRIKGMYCIIVPLILQN